MKKTILLLVIVPFVLFSFAQNSGKGSSKPKSITPVMKCSMKMDLTNFLPADTLKKINEIIYKSVTVGFNKVTIPAYYNDSLTSVNTAEEVLMKGTSEESVQITDPKYPDVLIDSVIRKMFNPSSDISGHYIHFIYSSTEGFDKYQVKIVGFAPGFKMKIHGISLPQQALFWLKFSDLKKVLPLNLYNDLTKACNTSMQKDTYKLIANRSQFKIDLVNILGEMTLYWDVNTIIHNKSLKGDVPAYKVNEFNTVIDKSNIPELGSTSEIVKVPDQSSPIIAHHEEKIIKDSINNKVYYYGAHNDYSELKDTTIINFYHLGSDDKNFILLEFKAGSTDLEFILTPLAFSLAYPDEMQNWKPLFWVKMTDFDRLFGYQDGDYFKKSIFKAVTKETGNWLYW